MQSGAALAAALVKVVKTITSRRVLRYALTLAEDLLTYDTETRAQLFTSDDGRLCVEPFFRCLSSFNDAYIQRQAAVVLAQLIRCVPRCRGVGSVEVLTPSPASPLSPPPVPVLRRTPLPRCFPGCSASFAATSQQGRRLRWPPRWPP